MNDDYTMFDKYKEFESENINSSEEEINFLTYSLAYNDYIENKDYENANYIKNLISKSIGDNNE